LFLENIKKYLHKVNVSLYLLNFVKKANINKLKAGGNKK